jgi:hypothetical protein
MFKILNLLATVAQSAVRADAARAALARTGIFIMLMMASFTVAMSGLGFGLYAAFVYLGNAMSPVAAAAVIAAAMLIIAPALIAAAWRLIIAPRGRRKAATAAASVSEEGLASLVRSLDQWARANPWQATAAALTIGFAIGSRR